MIRCRIGLYDIGLETGLFLRRQQVGTRPVRHFRRHADAFAQRGVWVNGFADVQIDLANHVARMRAHQAAAQDLAEAVGLG